MVDDSTIATAQANLLAARQQQQQSASQIAQAQQQVQSQQALRSQAGISGLIQRQQVANQISQAQQELSQGDVQIGNYQNQLKDYLSTDAGKLQFAKETGIKAIPVMGPYYKGEGDRLLGYKYETPYGEVIDYSPRDSIVKAETYRASQSQATGLGYQSKSEMFSKLGEQLKSGLGTTTTPSGAVIDFKTGTISLPAAQSNVLPGITAQSQISKIPGVQLGGAQDVINYLNQRAAEQNKQLQEARVNPNQFPLRQDNTSGIQPQSSVAALKTIFVSPFNALESGINKLFPNAKVAAGFERLPDIETYSLVPQKGVSQGINVENPRFTLVSAKDYQPYMQGTSNLPVKFQTLGEAVRQPVEVLSYALPVYGLGKMGFEAALGGESIYAGVNTAPSYVSTLEGVKDISGRKQLITQGLLQVAPLVTYGLAEGAGKLLSLGTKEITPGTLEYYQERVKSPSFAKDTFDQSLKVKGGADYYQKSVIEGPNQLANNPLLQRARLSLEPIDTKFLSGGTELTGKQARIILNEQGIIAKSDTAAKSLVKDLLVSKSNINVGSARFGLTELGTRAEIIPELKLSPGLGELKGTSFGTSRTISDAQGSLIEQSSFQIGANKLPINIKSDFITTSPEGNTGLLFDYKSGKVGSSDVEEALKTNKAPQRPFLISPAKPVRITEIGSFELPDGRVVKQLKLEIFSTGEGKVVRTPLEGLNKLKTLRPSDETINAMIAKGSKIQEQFVNVIRTPKSEGTFTGVERLGTSGIGLEKGSFKVYGESATGKTNIDIPFRRQGVIENLEPPKLPTTRAMKGFNLNSGGTNVDSQLTKLGTKTSDLEFIRPEQNLKMTSSRISLPRIKIASPLVSMASLESLPTIVGGAGAIASIYAGKGFYEKTSGNLLPSQLLSSNVPAGVTQNKSDITMSSKSLGKSLQALDLGLGQAQGPSSQQVQIPQEMQKISQLQDQFQEQIQQQAQVQTQIQMQQQFQRQEQLQQQTQMIVTPVSSTFPNSFIPRTPTPSRPFSSRNYSDLSLRKARPKQKVERGFIPLGRRRGKFSPLSGPQPTQQQAEIIGKRFAKETLGASYEVKGPKGLVPLAPSQGFRQAKRSPFILVQTQTTRLGTSGERQEIVNSRKAAKAWNFGKIKKGKGSFYGI